MNYPKRRASIACEYCRHRKRRCSGEKPSCQLCRSSGVTCQYIEIAAVRERPGVSNDALSRRVQELETHVLRQDSSLSSRFHHQAATPSTPESPVDALGSTNESPTSSEPWEQYPHTSTNVDASPNVDVREPRPREIDVSHITDEAPTLIIPPGHHTITGSLFTMRFVKGLIGEYPLDLFFRIECNRDLIPQPVSVVDISLIKSTLDLSPSTTQKLISNHFLATRPHFTVLEQDSFASYFESVTQQSYPKRTELAVCLLVLAIGALAGTASTDSTPLEEEHGLEYFSPAYNILMVEWTASLTPDISLSTGLLLASIYLRYLGRPLQAWKVNSMASSSLQLKILHSRNNTEPQSYDDVIYRLCWTCFVLECDALAEYHLPRSGIEEVIEHMRFPNFNSEIAGRDEMLFLAFFSVRRLLNRIHNSVYASDAAPSLEIASRLSIQSLENVLTELVRQLSGWYYSLPEMIRPDFDSNPCNIHDAWLRLRYWSAKHIITRPCLFYATTVDRAADLPQFVVEYSEMCIHSCRSYIKTAIYALKERTPYNWMTIQACLATALVLTVASTSTILRHLVQDLEHILGDVTAALQPWATTDPSADMVKMMLEALRRKQRLQIA